MVEKAVLRLKLHITEPRQFRNFVRWPREETPMLPVVVVRRRINFQHLRGVMRRIKGERQQVPIRRRVGHSAQLALHFLEISRKPRAILGDRTTSEEERQCDGLPAEICQAYGLAELIG